MHDNLPWLFYAFGAGWALLFLYLAWIARRETALRRRIEELSKFLPR